MSLMQHIAGRRWVLWVENHTIYVATKFNASMNWICVYITKCLAKFCLLLHFLIQIANI